VFLRVQRGINWRGTWVSTASYQRGDAVAYNGSSWFARGANTNEPPPGPDWLVLAAKGATGPKGSTGSRGPAGPGGPRGPTGPNGASGVSTVSGTGVPLNVAQTLTPVMTTPAVTSAGQYYVNASIMLVVGQGDTVACIADVNGGATGPFSTVGPVPNQTYETVSIAVDTYVPAGDTVSIECTGYTSNASPSFYDGGITATLIGTDNAAAPANRTAPKLPTPPLAIGRAAR